MIYVALPYSGVVGFSPAQGPRSTSSERPTSGPDPEPPAIQVRGQQVRWQLLRRHGPGAAMAVSTAAMMSWGLSRPAFWLDEAASVLATQRTWSNLWALMGGAEAPLVPYYAVLKSFTGLTDLMPALRSQPEVHFRLLSVICTVLAGWLLIGWLARLCSVRLALVTGALLVLTVGFSRYGQEARPYPLVLLCAVAATIAWSYLITERSRRWAFGYAVCLAATVALHTLGGLILLVHLLAAPLCTDRGRRWSALARTTLTAAPALLVVSPLVLATALNGTGPRLVFPDVTVDRAFRTFGQLFTLGEIQLLGVGPIVLLAALGVTRFNSERYRFITRLAACWAMVPLLGLLLVTQVKPNLLFGRYVIYVLPGWAILAGLGVLTLVGWVTAVFARLPGSEPMVAGSIGAVVMVALLGGTVAHQRPTLTKVRTIHGHGEDIRPALAAAALPRNAELPIVASSRPGSIISLSAYQPELERRLVGFRIQRNENRIWPVVAPPGEVREFLTTQNQVLLILRTGPGRPCRAVRPLIKIDQIERCLPAPLPELGYQVERVEAGGYGWSVAVMTRTSN